jgi:hypothetical protein
MAGPVRLSDMFISPVYLSYTTLNNPEQSRFVRSGIIAVSDTMSQIARSSSKLATVPFIGDIDPTIEPNYSNDDPADLAVPNKIGTGSMTGRKAWLNQGFSSMRLVQELSGINPMERIKERFDTYWTRAQERRLIAMAKGLLAANLAKNNGDMVKDITAGTGDAGVFNRRTFIAAAYQLGEDVENIRAIAVHSAIMATMVDNDDIIMIPDSEGKLTIPTYMGRLVLVTDNLPVEGTGANAVFTSILYGTGSFSFGGADGACFAVGEGIPQLPVEVFSTPRAGHGGGMEEIWERKTWMMHPQGFSWTDPTGADAIVEFSPTLADLAKAAPWTRVVARRQVPMVFIKSRASSLS